MLCNIKRHSPCKTRSHHYILFLLENESQPLSFAPENHTAECLGDSLLTWGLHTHTHTHTTAPPCVINTFTTPPQISPSEMVSIVYVQGKSLYDCVQSDSDIIGTRGHQVLQVTVPLLDCIMMWVTFSALICSLLLV